MEDLTNLDLFDGFYSAEGALERKKRRRERLYAPREDIIARYSDDELYGRFRFDRQGIYWLAELLERVLRPPTDRNNPLSPLHQVILTTFYCLG